MNTNPNVIVETSRGIQTISIEDKMLNDSREIFLTGEVNAENCNQLITQLLFLDRMDNSGEITLYINSPGGSVSDGLAVYDVINIISAPVKTVCIGTAASMGAILFLAGKERLMTAHSKIMIHDPSFNQLNVGGKKPHEIQSQVDDLNKCRESLAKIISDRTGKGLDEIYEVTANDSYFTLDEAVEFGLATGELK